LSISFFAACPSRNKRFQDGEVGIVLYRVEAERIFCGDKGATAGDKFGPLVRG
jgi:hypothetical protein